VRACALDVDASARPRPNRFRKTLRARSLPVMAHVMTVGSALLFAYLVLEAMGVGPVFQARDLQGVVGVLASGAGTVVHAIDELARLMPVWIRGAAPVLPFPF
jgi:hypothetical protein